jgi:GTP cyclohydrolase IB
MTHTQTEKAPTLGNIVDVQSTPDTRRLAIQQVGVRGVRQPLLIENPNKSTQATIATWNMYVHLPEHQKGTHMSRFIALLEARHETAFNVSAFDELLNDMLQLLEADAGRIEANFPIFIKKKAPISGVESLLDYQLNVTHEKRNGKHLRIWQIVVPVTSLCPCSKKISDYGAHNQRSHVTLQVHLTGELDLYGLISGVEQQASCELYGLLKRPDEKYVTERAYDNPKFVEDLVRDIAIFVSQQPNIDWYRVEAENFESIHNHSAYALIEKQ